MYETSARVSNDRIATHLCLYGGIFLPQLVRKSFDLSGLYVILSDIYVDL